MNAYNHLTKTPITIQDAKKVLIVSRPNPELLPITVDLAQWLASKGLTVLIQEGMRDYASKNSTVHSSTSEASAAGSQGGSVEFWSLKNLKEHADSIDFIITLGGDGTVLYTSWLFQKRVPPVIPFYFGSLGFLTVFSFDSHKTVLEKILDGEPQHMNLRMRLQASIYKAHQSRNSKSGFGVGGEKMSDTEWKPEESTRTFTGQVLNEVVVDRGANPTMLTMEI
jgi:NAD+ kinase